MLSIFPILSFSMFYMQCRLSISPPKCVRQWHHARSRPLSAALSNGGRRRRQDAELLGHHGRAGPRGAIEKVEGFHGFVMCVAVLIKSSAKTICVRITPAQSAFSRLLRMTRLEGGVESFLIGPPLNDNINLRHHHQCPSVFLHPHTHTHAHPRHRNYCERP